MIGSVSKASNSSIKKELKDLKVSINKMQKNTKTLIIVESPNKISKIKSILGDQYEVIASYGHIRDLNPLPKKGIGVSLDDKFEPEYVLLKDKVEVVKKILNLAEKCDQIYLCSDFDPEGEAISFHLQYFLRNLGKPIKRAIFTEITKQGIKKGLENLREVDLNLCSAQRNRRILDRVVGFLSSSLIMNIRQTPSSAGRVQSVACALVLQREAEIEQFKPEQYFNLYIQFIKENKETFIAKYDGKIKTLEQANKIIETIKQEPQFIVANVKTKQELKYPAPPLITVSIQQLLSKSHNFTPEHTLSLCQNLFEQGYCTYIRTGSLHISDEALDMARSYLKSKNYELPKSAIKYTKEEGAHEVIRPTDLFEDPKLSGDLKIVYGAIRKYFIASQMLPAVFNTLQVKITGTKNTKLTFKISGKALEKANYLEVFGKSEKEKIDIPLLEEKEKLNFDPKKIKCEKKFTQPPSHFNDASLLKDLEVRGIGKPSTYASIISLISHRNYVEKKNNTYYATDLGKEITAILSKHFSFMNFDFTKRMEDDLDLVAEGKLNPLKMLQDFYSKFKSELDRAYIDNGFELCKCGGVMLKRKNDKGEFLGCNKFCGNLIVLSRNEGQTKEAV